MSILRRRSHEVPGLNTSSLPDLIFTVLFFFMIVTHMQKNTVKVRFQVPQGTQLTRLVKKSAISYIYIGTSTGAPSAPTRIQLNDKLVTTDELTDYMAAERQRMAPADQQQMTVSIKADRHTKMGVMQDVKTALRRAQALKICYTATDKKR